MRGNPNFATSEYQKGMAARRWEGHVSKAAARLIVRGLLELEFERAAAQAREILGENVNDDVESWEPYELDDEPADGPGEPVEPFYTEQSLRDKAARKAARQKRKDPAE